MDYGYEGEVYLPVPITAAKTARPGAAAALKAAVSLLVCKDICVPEDAVLQLTLPVAAASTAGRRTPPSPPPWRPPPNRPASRPPWR